MGDPLLVGPGLSLVSFGVLHLFTTYVAHRLAGVPIGSLSAGLLLAAARVDEVGEAVDGDES